jgi:hypothetical protein
MACEAIRENVEGSYKLKKHKPGFDEGYSKVLDKKKPSRTAIII